MKAGVIILGLALGGCAVVPQPLTEGERGERIQSDMNSLFKDVAPMGQGLSLHEAFARALKYNYDFRLKQMEQALTSAQLDVAHYDMLPRLTTSAGYSNRSNDAGSRSINLSTGQESDLFSGASERTINRANAAFAWNILDFGVSYVRAQQQAEQNLISEERKRKVIQNILQDVRQAYWRAYGAQQVLPRLDQALNRVGETLARSRLIEQQKLLPPQQALAYQRALIDLYQQIVQKRQELVLAKTELSALINLRPGTEFSVAPGEEEQAAARLRPLENLDALDEAALKHRPELREEDYRKRVTVLEARKALLGLLPGIEINIGRNYDSNKFLLNNTWTEAGASVSFNLFRAFSYPALKRQQEVQQQLDDARRIALSMAVLTQVRIAAQRYHEALTDFSVSQMGAEVDARLRTHTLNGTQASAESEMELLRVEVKALLSEMQRYVALANLQGAYARMANSVGADLVPAEASLGNLGDLASSMRLADHDWQKTAFRTVSGDVTKLPVSLEVMTLGPAQINLGELIHSRLEAHGAYASVAGDTVPSVRAEIKLGESRAGLRRVEVDWIVSQGGRELGRVPYHSVVPEGVPASWQAFAEAAAEAAANQIARLLREQGRKAPATVSAVAKPTPLQLAALQWPARPQGMR